MMQVKKRGSDERRREGKDRDRDRDGRMERRGWVVVSVRIQNFNIFFLRNDITETNTWCEPEVQGDVPLPRTNHACTVLDNKMYIHGGNVSAVYQRTQVHKKISLSSLRFISLKFPQNFHNK